MESFILVSQSAQFSHYAALLIFRCRCIQFCAFKKVLGLVFCNEAFCRIVKRSKTNFLLFPLYPTMFSSASCGCMGCQGHVF